MKSDNQAKIQTKKPKGNLIEALVAYVVFAVLASQAVLFRLYPF